MADSVSLASAMVDSLDRRDVDNLRRLVPQRFWRWRDGYLQHGGGWQTIEELAGEPRRVIRARPLGPKMARLTIRGPRGEAFVTATFDEQDQLKGFALDAEEYEGSRRLPRT